MIKIYPNLINVKDCQELLDIFNPISLGKDMSYFGKQAENNGTKKVSSVKHKIIDDALLSMNHGMLVDNISIVYYPTGSMNTEHCDNSQLDIIDGVVTIKRFKDWNYTGIVFLNNNFTGGELVYPNQGCVFLPTIGTMILAPAGPEYTHYVSTITSGDRATLVIRFI